jgi:hypothetical protein
MMTRRGALEVFAMSVELKLKVKVTAAQDEHRLVCRPFRVYRLC